MLPAWPFFLFSKNSKESESIWCDTLALLRIGNDRLLEYQIYIQNIFKYWRRSKQFPYFWLLDELLQYGFKQVGLVDLCLYLLTYVYHDTTVPATQLWKYFWLNTPPLARADICWPSVHLKPAWQSTPSRYYSHPSPKYTPLFISKWSADHCFTEPILASQTFQNEKLKSGHWKRLP